MSRIAVVVASLILSLAAATPAADGDPLVVALEAEAASRDFLKSGAGSGSYSLAAWDKAAAEWGVKAEAKADFAFRDGRCRIKLDYRSKIGPSGELLVVYDGKRLGWTEFGQRRPQTRFTEPPSNRAGYVPLPTGHFRWDVSRLAAKAVVLQVLKDTAPQERLSATFDSGGDVIIRQIQTRGEVVVVCPRDTGYNVRSKKTYRDQVLTEEYEIEWRGADDGWYPTGLTETRWHPDGAKIRQKFSIDEFTPNAEVPEERLTLTLIDGPDGQRIAD